MIKIINIDCIKGMQQLPDNSIDLVLTDPPYNEKSIHLYVDTAKELRRILKEGGFAAYYANDLYFKETFTEMIKHIDFFYLFHLYMPGKNASIIKYNLRVGAKTIIVFSNGRSRMKKQISNHLVSPQRMTGKLHKWQQNVFPVIKLIEGLTNRGDTVLDMMVGSGTTGLACKMTDRKFIGFDIDKDAIEIAKQTISKFNHIDNYLEW